MSTSQLELKFEDNSIYLQNSNFYEKIYIPRDKYELAHTLAYNFDKGNYWQLFNKFHRKKKSQLYAIYFRLNEK